MANPETTDIRGTPDTWAPGYPHQVRTDERNQSWVFIGEWRELLGGPDSSDLATHTIADDQKTTELAPLATAREALSRELVRDIAMEIGKEVASHIETMYPKAVEATSKSMLLSLRNSVHNDIMAAVDALEHGNAEAWLARRQAHRRAIRAEWRKRKAGTILDGEAIYEQT